VNLLGINPGGDWYKIQYYNAEGWVAARFVDATGNVASLPVDAGPPTPLPTNTPLPPTNTPIPVLVNLVPVNIQTSPHPLVCQKSSEIQVTVRNDGSAASTSGGLIRVRAILDSSGETLAQTETAFGPLQSGQQQTVSAFLTVSVHHSETQHITIDIDHTNQVPESNENDNSRNDAPYVLQKGTCP
jgi:hypothetical protein